jgi:hypothetical protein
LKGAAAAIRKRDILAFREAKPARRAGFYFSPDAVVLASPKLSSIVELELRPIGMVCAGLSAELRNRG